MQVKASQKQVKGKTEGNGALLCVCFALLIGKESCHMSRSALYVLALLCLWEGGCHMSRFALLSSWEREAVTHYGLLCLVLLCFARARGKLSHVTICFALL